MNEEHLLTTVDNPYNPFTNFDEWYVYDSEMGYNTCNYLARLARTSSSDTESIEQQIIDAAIDEIVDFNINGKYVKVSEKNFDQEIEAAKKRFAALSSK